MLGAEQLLAGPTWQFFNRRNRKGRRNGGTVVATMKCPFGVPGDQLWVQEAHAVVPWIYEDGEEPRDRVVYRADDPAGNIFSEDAGDRWRPSTWMTREASRYVLDIIGVGAEPVQCLTEGEAFYEGVERLELTSGILTGVDPPFNQVHPLTSTYVEAYRARWNKAYGADAWDRNDWVWVVQVNKIEGNTS